MEKKFKSYLDDTGEVGYAERIVHSIIYGSGLPGARPNEIVVFETGQIGEVLSLNEEYVEILLLSEEQVRVGTKIARTDKPFQIEIGEGLLGKVVDPTCRVRGSTLNMGGDVEVRETDISPPGIASRKNIDKPFETGVSVVDLIVPLGKGQRELVVGDRKTGKTQLLMQSTLTQAQSGTVCIYAAIAKKILDIKELEAFIKKNKIEENTIVVATGASDPAGLVYKTPYTAMTIAEYFRDRGRDVFVALDDLSAHAKYYREISLLAKRFPGRSAYPGDIFYLHSRLLERAGNFVLKSKDEKGKVAFSEVSITCLPVAELVLGDLSGYIQTNLMAMTDGHVFFDSDLFNQGRRPAVNPFLSVTRVGRQAQTQLLRDLNRQVTRFLVYVEKLREFLHFGAELSESTQRTLAMGDRLIAFFNQSSDKVVPLKVNIIIISAIWGGFWKGVAINNMNKNIAFIVDTFKKDANYRQRIENFIASSNTFDDIVAAIKQNQDILLGQAKLEGA
jgi:F-type H+-transporting ATPase subunit alpha